MSNYRLATLLASESITTAGTKTIDIKMSDPISKISIQHKATSAGTVLTDHPAGNLSRIEMVDGSKTIFSLTGKQMQALDFYNMKYSPWSFLCDVSGVMAIETFNYHFGRHLWDTALAFDPTKFRNPQLKITHNYRTADAAASAATLEVYAHAFDKKEISPVGYLSAKEHKSYTCGAQSTIEYITLPRDNPIRQLMIRGAASDYFPWQVSNKIKLNESGGKSIPIETQVSAWLKHINQIYPRVVEPAMIAVNATARDIYTMPSYDIAIKLMPQTVTNIISQESANKPSPIALDITDSDVCTGEIHGWQPHSCFPIPFGNQADMDDWYMVGDLTDLELEVTAGSAGTNGTVQIVTEQLEKY